MTFTPRRGKPFHMVSACADPTLALERARPHSQWSGAWSNSEQPVSKTGAYVNSASGGIRSVCALCRKLDELGIDISESQLSRIIDGKSSQFNAKVVGGLLTALDCGLNDLLVVR